MSKEIEEVLALRSGACYELYEEEPESRPFWAIKAVPCRFPGDHHLVTRDGAPVVQYAIVVAERRSDNNLWQWCHPTMAFKRIVGDLLLENTTEHDRWYYVTERQQ